MAVKKQRRRRGQPELRLRACRFCKEKITYIDYKDIESLQKLTTRQGKLFSRTRSGNCAKCQRMAKAAIKRARFIALMPYSGNAW
ncbi:MAG: 30S ribosomal protein S18 [Planctomycetota bacterium]|nr:30S ribosomal protein S18 [Planctomycetota bacterium]MDA1142956.1 30S ribosomal protein S18 [Planctomycetota bacterium]